MLLSLAGLTGCQPLTSSDQANICMVSDDASAMECKPGKLIFFRPDYFGNEQLPLNIAAAYCDFNHQVMHNKSGVICVFTDKRLSLVGG
jgi:hypothetical protein